MDQATPHSGGGRLQPRRRGPWRLVRANLYDFGLLLREARLALVGFVVVVLLGSLYLSQHFRLRFLDALYQALQLLIFQTSHPLPSDVAGELVFFLLPLLGLALIVQSVLNFGRRLLDKGSRREAWQVALASTYRDHIILCGLGRVGLRVLTRLLEAGYDVIAIERDFGSRFVARALELHVPVIQGDAREVGALRQAGLRRARAVIAAINGDLLNIEIALTVRGERPGARVILRAFSEELDRNLERVFGAYSTFSSSSLAAPTFAAAAVSRAIAYAFPLGSQLVGMTQLVVERGSALEGTALADLEAGQGVRVLERLPRAEGGQALRAGDHLTLLGPLAALEAARLRNLPPGSDPAALPAQHPTAAFDRVIICGLGKVGYRVAQRLHALEPRPRIVVVHQDDPGASFVEQIAPLDGVELVRGDARDPAVLRRAGIEHAYAVAAVTSDDLVNLQISLAARRLREEVHVVVRVFSDALAEELNSVFEIHTTYSTSNLASATLAAAAVVGRVSRAFATGGHLYARDEVVARAGDGLCGKTLGAVRAARGVLVLGIQRKEQTLVLPALDEVAQPGDALTVVAPLAALAKLRGG
ncbi:MAG TPA: NAD-binding protein [Ktedonobacterales bacterium]